MLCKLQKWDYQDVLQMLGFDWTLYLFEQPTFVPSLKQLWDAERDKVPALAHVTISALSCLIGYIHDVDAYDFDHDAAHEHVRFLAVERHFHDVKCSTL